MGVDALTRGQATRLHQHIREVPKPAPSASQPQPTALAGVAAASSAGNDPNTRSVDGRAVPRPRPAQPAHVLDRRPRRRRLRPGHGSVSVRGHGAGRLRGPGAAPIARVTAGRDSASLPPSPAPVSAPCRRPSGYSRSSDWLRSRSATSADRSADQQPLHAVDPARSAAGDRSRSGEVAAAEPPHRAGAGEQPRGVGRRGSSRADRAGGRTAVMGRPGSRARDRDPRSLCTLPPQR